MFEDSLVFLSADILLDWYYYKVNISQSDTTIKYYIFKVKKEVLRG